MTSWKSLPDECSYIVTDKQSAGNYEYPLPTKPISALFNSRGRIGDCVVFAFVEWSKGDARGRELCTTHVNLLKTRAQQCKKHLQKRA